MKTLAAVLAALGIALPAAAQTIYVAFGDSITAGVGDDPERIERGYPPRLELLLGDAGETVQVVNRGLPGETTAEGVSRIEQVLDDEAQCLLLMEGTNDITFISAETIRFNLDQIAQKAQNRDIETVIASVIPRHPSANTDGSNRATRALAREVRDYAWSSVRRFADPFEVFFATPNVFVERYVGGSDRVHPNGPGYDLLAEIFADVLLDRDRVPPVLGETAPRDGARNVAAGTPVEVDLYDFGAGIDLNATTLVVNGREVDALFEGGPQRYQISYTPPEAFGVFRVRLRAADLATPANEVDVHITEYTLTGTQFLDGDLNEDGRVDGLDLVRLATGFGAVAGDQRYRFAADLNQDGRIDGLDLAILASNFAASSF